MHSLPDHLDTVFGSEITRRYPKGQAILFQNDPVLDVVYLRRGLIKIFDTDNNGIDKILHLLKPPAILPFVFFSGDATITQWNYSALTDCDVSVMPSERLMALMGTNAPLTLTLLKWFSVEANELMVRLSSMSKTNTRDKFIAALKFLVMHHAVERRNGWWRVTFSVNQQLLADMTGMTRESGAMIMKLFKNEKIIRQPRLTILEINRVNLLHEDHILKI